MQPIWIILLLGSCAVAVVWFVLRQSRKTSEKRELREQVQTWEDEGGNVPDVPPVRPVAGKH